MNKYLHLAYASLLYNKEIKVECGCKNEVHQLMPQNWPIQHHMPSYSSHKKYANILVAHTLGPSLDSKHRISVYQSLKIGNCFS